MKLLQDFNTNSEITDSSDKKDLSALAMLPDTENVLSHGSEVEGTVTTLQDNWAFPEIDFFKKG